MVKASELIRLNNTHSSPEAPSPATNTSSVAAAMGTSESSAPSSLQAANAANAKETIMTDLAVPGRLCLERFRPSQSSASADGISRRKSRTTWTTGTPRSSISTYAIRPSGPNAVGM